MDTNQNSMIVRIIVCDVMTCNCYLIFPRNSAVYISTGETVTSGDGVRTLLPSLSKFADIISASGSIVIRDRSTASIEEALDEEELDLGREMFLGRGSGVWS